MARTQGKSAWDKAREAGARVFHEPETDTIRTQPENYLIAYREDGAWHFDVDAALLGMDRDQLNLILTEAVRMTEIFR